MKKVYLFYLFVISSTLAWAQCSVTVSGSTNVTCNGLCNGSATLVTVGTPPYTYVWSPGGQTTQNPNNLCAGTHTVTMTDASSCVATATVTITQPAALSATSTNVHVSCNGNCDGSIDITVSGGTTPYTYSWSPGGATTADISALCAGIYTCTVTDNNNCTFTFIDTITQPAVLNVSATAMTGCGSACDKNGIATPNGGTAPYTYLWSPGGQTGATATGLCAGTYSVVVTDANGCTAAGVVSISNPATLSASATCNPALCFGGTGIAAVTAGGGTPSYTYLWSGGQTTANVTGLVAGTYTCTVTDANGCTVTATCSVTQPSSALSVTATATSSPCSTCTNGTSNATATGGTPPYTYSWSPGGCTSVTCTGLVPGTYTVTVTDANGCTTTGTATVINTFGINDEPGLPGVTIGPNPASDWIIIDTERQLSNAWLEVYDHTGKRIFVTGIRSVRSTFDTGTLPAGLYIFWLHSDEGSTARKVILE